MSALSNKINSYAIENGISFDSTYAFPPVQTGTVTNPGSSDWLLSGKVPVYETGVTPLGGGGSWKFISDSSTGCRVRNTGTVKDLINDGDYSVGIWVKFNNLNYGSTANPPLLAHQPAFTGGYILTTGYNSGTDKYYPQLTYGTTSVILDTTTELNTTDWFYYAVTKIGSELKFYINGVLKGTVTNAQTPTAQNLNFGQVYQGFTFSLNLANFYIASPTTIAASQIAEIWTAGSTLSATPVADPASATALLTEPTIVIVANDNVQVTTSFLASTTIPDNISIAASQNINIVITEVLTASVELINNVIIVTDTDESVSAQEFTATASFPMPVVPVEIMTASATMPGGSAYVTPNYFNIIKPLNPYMYIFNGSATPVNYGYQTGTFTVSSGLQKLVTPPSPLDLVAEGKSWKSTDNSGTDASIRFNTSSNTTSFDAILATQEWSFEQWIVTPSYTGSIKIIDDPSLNVTFVEGPLTATVKGISVTLKTGPTTTSTFFSTIPNGPTNSNSLYHVVVTSTKVSSTQQLVRVWVNGSSLYSNTFTFASWTSNKNNFFAINSDGWNMIHDEIALYDFPLNSSQILQHFNFINNLSPNYTDIPEPFIANSTSGNHQFIYQKDISIAESPATASLLFVEPTVIASRSISIIADPMLSSAANTNVVLYLGITVTAEPMISAAESKEGFFLSDIYYNYVQTNIAPYRYVTFDAADTLFDYGTDNDYSVAPTTIGGTIVSPQFGINGKSAKTAGTSYVTDGVILNESEWNDSWGTGANDWHSAFWFQRALDDNSTTGLRVLWNLNGYKDNQHAVLYQYQGRLHMQFNNGSGTFTETDSTTLDLFDYNRHFVVIDHNHGGGSTNTIKLYVDSVLRFTVNIGSITPTTTNAVTADSGPNDEANSRPRLSIGCLITPFGSTALPVAPANTKLIIDEIYWDKNSITQTQVTNLKNAMPGVTTIVNIVSPFESNANSVMPAVSTQSIQLASAMTVSAIFVDPAILAVRIVNVGSNAMVANALIVHPQVSQLTNISAEPMIATSIFNDAGVLITIPAQPMLATAILAPNVGGVYYPPSYPIASPVTYLFKNIPTIYVRYLMNKAYINSIPLYKEIK